MSECENLANETLVIVVLCYRRTEHLRKVLDGLENALLVESFSIVFVVQDPIESVLGIIHSSKLSNKTILEVDGSKYVSPAQAINGNLAKGLSYSFQILKSQFTIVLEDDIVISKDALCFFLQAYKTNISVRGFRGVNAFSESVDIGPGQNGVLRLNYGLGWGWAIPKKTYLGLSRYWTGYENDHWDFVFEPYIRTGFVVNPRRSRILNIGFDDSATHTSMNKELNWKIEVSFIQSIANHTCELVLENNSFPWMGHELNLLKNSLGWQSRVGTLSRLLFLVYVLDFGDRKIYHRTKRFFSKFYS